MTTFATHIKFSGGSEQNFEQKILVFGGCHILADSRLTRILHGQGFLCPGNGNSDPGRLTACAVCSVFSQLSAVAGSH